MTGSATIWIVVGLACVAANLPFLFERVLFVWSPPSGRKGFGWRFLELLVFYLVVGGLAFLLEKNAYGVVYPKNWQFYAATFCLFIGDNRRQPGSNRLLKKSEAVEKPMPKWPKTSPQSCFLGRFQSVSWVSGV